jgi:hypothetical protein
LLGVLVLFVEDLGQETVPGAGLDDVGVVVGVGHFGRLIEDSDLLKGDGNVGCLNLVLERPMSSTRRGGYISLVKYLPT